MKISSFGYLSIDDYGFPHFWSKLELPRLLACCLADKGLLNKHFIIHTVTEPYFIHDQQPLAYLEEGKGPPPFPYLDLPHIWDLVLL